MSALIPAIIEMFIKMNRRGRGGGGYGGRGGYGAGGKEPRDEDAYSWKLMEKNARADNIQFDMDGIAEATNLLKTTNAQVNSLQAQVDALIGKNK